MKIPSCFLRGVLGALMVLLAAAIIIPQYADYRERAANAAILNESLALQQAIEARIQGLGAVENSGLGIEVPPEGTDYKAVITRDGAVILQGIRYGHVMVLTPRLAQGAVSWQCVGGPPKDMPRQCRPED